HTGCRVRRPADDRERAVRQSHAAELVVVAGRGLTQIMHDGFDLPDHDPRETLHDGRDRRDLDAGVDQTLGEVAWREIGLDELLQPAIGDIHRPDVGGANCCKNLRSFSKRRRMSSMPYFSMVTRSTPMPKAQPVTSSGS